MLDPEKATLKEAKELLRQQFLGMKGGSKCPCCRQLAKLLPKSLTATLAAQFLLIYKYYVKENIDPDVYFNVTEYFTVLGPKGSVLYKAKLTKGKAFEALRWWGLLESRAKDARPDGTSKKGEYRITDLGVRFAAGSVKIPRRVFTFNGLCWDGELVLFDPVRLANVPRATVQEILGAKFRYEDLLGVESR
jgi:hypothetical protein